MRFITKNGKKFPIKGRKVSVFRGQNSVSEDAARKAWNQKTFVTTHKVVQKVRGWEVKLSPIDPSIKHTRTTIETIKKARIKPGTARIKWTNQREDSI